MDALIVAGTPTRQHAITDVLYHEKLNCVVCSTAAEARQVSMCRPFDIFVVYSGLVDELGNTLAMYLADANDCGGVYIDDSVRTEQIAAELSSYGVITLARPVTKSALIEAVRLIFASNARVQRLKHINEELTAKIEDIQYISRAKIVLMRSLGYSDEQAHKYIEKKAMDSRLSKRKVAIDILTTYEGI